MSASRPSLGAGDRVADYLATGRSERPRRTVRVAGEGIRSSPVANLRCSTYEATWFEICSHGDS